jgi:hypothetical protein
MTMEATVIDIPADLDVAGAAAERDRLLAALDASDGAPAAIRLDAAQATQPALQLFFAARREIERRGAQIATRLTGEKEPG